MKFDVLLAPRETEYTLTVEAASPQLAALHADKRFGNTCDVVAVDGTVCLGKCERCERHVFQKEDDAIAVESGILCGLCIKEMRAEPMQRHIVIEDEDAGRVYHLQVRFRCGDEIGGWSPRTINRIRDQIAALKERIEKELK